MHLIAVAILDPTDVPGGFTADDGEAADREPPRPAAAVPAPGRAGAVRAAPPALDRGPRLRPRLPRAPGRGARRRVARASSPTFVGEVAGWPLDRDRPLWQMWVAEGLEHGHVALDRQGAPRGDRRRVRGRGAREPRRPRADAGPDRARRERVEPWQADRVPSDVEMIGASMVSIARQPVRMARAVVHLGQVAGPARDPDPQRGRAHGVPFTAPRLSWNVMITPHRQVAFSRDLARRREGREGRVRRDGERRRARRRCPVRSGATSSSATSCPTGRSSR